MMSKRLEAWRNLMVAAINTGVDQGVFSLEPDGMHHSDVKHDDPSLHGAGLIYDFELNDRPARKTALASILKHRCDVPPRGPRHPHG